MANTPRTGSAFIVFGVNWSPENGAEVVGIDEQFDDVDFQDKFPSTAIHPRPRFTYYPLRMDEHQVGVLEIPITEDGPFASTSDLGLAKRSFQIQGGVVYYRRGTQNVRAVGADLKRIHRWFETGEDDRTESWDTDAWRQFLDGVRRFESDRCYLLAADSLAATPGTLLEAFSLQPWRAVIDFDPRSDVDGLLKHIGSTLASSRVVHRAVDSHTPVRPDPATHWYFARGVEGLRESVSTGSHISWLKTHKRALSRQLERIASAVSPRPVVAVVVWSDEDGSPYLIHLMAELHVAFGEAMELIVVGEGGTLASVVQESGGTYVQMPVSDLCHGLTSLHASRSQSSRSLRVLPSSSGAPIELPADDWLWLSEDLDVAHLGVGVEGDDNATNFRTGGEISWRNLNLRHDCERDISPAVAQRVAQDLQNRQTTRINLYHAPGAGGTTVGRRVAWDLHRTYPVAVLRHLAPDTTAEKIGRIFGLTRHSVLVVVDGGQHAERDIDDLYERLKANNTPAVLLQVLRRFDQQNVGPRQFWLGDGLSGEEADRFRDVYAQAVPGRRAALEQLAGGSDGTERSAFFFGLTAFEEDYRGLKEYVEVRMPDLTETQAQILIFAAVAYYYGQQPLPAQAFAMLLGLPVSRTLHLADAFSGQPARALGLLIETTRGEWRPSHQLIALQILRHHLAPTTAQDPDRVWRQRLSEYAKQFVDFCRAEGYPESEQLLELARRVFIYRDNVEVLGTERASQTRYAQLLEDIPSPQGRMEVLEHLTSRFPDEAHFQSHLARLLSQAGEYNRALQRADYAIALQPDDHVLHHMHGMVHREEMRRAIRVGTELRALTEVAKLAIDSFTRARSLRPEEEHSYVSEVQTLILLVDYAARGKQDVVADVLTNLELTPSSKPPWTGRTISWIRCYISTAGNDRVLMSRTVERDWRVSSVTTRVPFKHGITCWRGRTSIAPRFDDRSYGRFLDAARTPGRGWQPTNSGAFASCWRTTCRRMQTTLRASASGCAQPG